MKSGKATGSDDLAAELWKLESLKPADWLTQLSNQIVKEKKTSSDWNRSTTVPICKQKGNPADCASYRPIRLPGIV